ncbi:MAG: hypothetical protein KGD64_05455 [Candidatus Heimdallarchaeota archaeon]|nr:hypothetical protein [Candidatus Heimdallarchaeota archaeon]
MKKILKKVILAVILIIVVSNFAYAQDRADGEYFSSKLTAGSILYWDDIFSTLIPDQETFDPVHITLTILQDVPDEPITILNYENYFNITYNDLYYTSWTILQELIVPNLYVQNEKSSTIHEYYVATYGESEEHEVEHSFGNTELTHIALYINHEFTIVTKIDDETGIIRERTLNLKTYNGDDVVSENQYTTIYKGGIELANAETSTVILVLIGIPLVYIIRRRRKIQPPLG